VKGALKEFKIGPVRTTIPLHIRIMDNKDFRKATHDIHYIERWLK
jgi:acetyl-CoA carboxylase biotin carboxylase subunit